MRQEQKEAEKGHVIKPTSTEGTGTGSSIESLPLSY